MSIVHIMSSGRALAAIVAVSGLFAIWSNIFGRVLPPNIKPFRFLVICLFGLLNIFIIYEGAKWATQERLFSPELQRKMERQLSNPYGLLAAGRPDTFAALHGIQKSPVLGFGSTNADPDVMSLYRNIVVSTYSREGWAEAYRELLASREWSLGTPSHSHVFGAWVDAGVFAAISWIVVFVFAAYVLFRSVGWYHPMVPLFILISMFCLWDLLFSPGPIRMDIAIRLAVLIYAAELLRQIDASKQQELARTNRRSQLQFRCKKLVAGCRDIAPKYFPGKTTIHSIRLWIVMSRRLA